jgi:hypothetical protein
MFRDGSSCTAWTCETLESCLCRSRMLRHRSEPRAPKPVLITDHRVPHISLVFREMWDTTAPPLWLCLDNYSSGMRAVVSQISRKTSEIWGTRSVVVRKELKGWRNVISPKRCWGNWNVGELWFPRRVVRMKLEGDGFAAQQVLDYVVEANLFKRRSYVLPGLLTRHMDHQHRTWV